jgi:hypothetical protein
MSPLVALPGAAGNFREAITVAHVRDENGHLHHVTEPAARLLQSAVEILEKLPYLAAAPSLSPRGIHTARETRAAEGGCLLSTRSPPKRGVKGLMPVSLDSRGAQTGNAVLINRVLP